MKLNSMLRCMHLEASINTTTVGFKKEEECLQNMLKEFTGNFDFFFFLPYSLQCCYSKWEFSATVGYHLFPGGVSNRRSWNNTYPKYLGNLWQNI